MSAAWEDMTDIERASALELMGGKRQANILSSIIKNFQTVEDVIATSVDSEGSALKENEKYLDSIQGKVDQFTNSMQTMWNNALNSDVIKWFVDFGITLTKIIDKVGLLKTILFGLIMYLSKSSKISVFTATNGQLQILGKTINQIRTSFSQLSSESTGIFGKIKAGFASIFTNGNSGAIDLSGMLSEGSFNEKLNGLISGFNGLKGTVNEISWDDYVAGITKSDKAMGAALKTCTMQNGAIVAGEGAYKAYTGATASAAVGTAAVGQTAGVTTGKLIAMKVAALAANAALTMGISFLVSGAISAIMKLTDAESEAAESAREAAAASKELQEQNASLEEYKNKIVELRKELDTNSLSEADAYTKREELLKIQDELIEKFGLEKDSINLVTGAINDQIGAIDKLSQQNAQKWLNENRKEINNAIDYFASDDQGSKMDNWWERTFGGGNGIVNWGVTENVADMINEYASNNEHINATGAFDQFGLGGDTIELDISFSGSVEEVKAQFEDFTKWTNDKIEELNSQKIALEADPNQTEETKKQIKSLESDIAQLEDVREDLGVEFKNWFGEDSEYQANKDLLEQLQKNTALTTYADQYAKILQAQNNFQEAQAKGDQEAIDQALTTLNSALDEASKDAEAKGQSYMVDFFNGMKDKAATGDMNLRKALSTDKTLKEELNKTLSAFEGKNAEEILQFGKIDPNNSAFVQLTELAKKYDMTIEELMNSLIKLGYVQSGFGNGEAEKAKSIVKTYSDLSSTIASFNEVQKQTELIVIDNTEVTQEYKDSLIELGISESDLSDCFDENNKLVVKNASRLKQLVSAAKTSISTQTTLARAQARLKYKELYKQLASLTNGQLKNAQANRAQINTLYQEMSAVQKTIAKYSLLEQQLAGVTKTYSEFEEAQSTDNEYDYMSKTEEMLVAAIKAYETGELGTETAQVSIKALVPDVEFEGLDTVEEKAAKAHEYLTETLNKYFVMEFDDNGEIQSAEMKMGNLRKFIEDGFGKNVFDGADWQHFEWSDEFLSGLEDAPDKLQYFADKMKVTKEVALAVIQEINNHDIEWLNGDYGSLFDQIVPETLDSKLQTTTARMAELNVQLANGKITQKEYEAAMGGLNTQLANGVITQDQYNTKIAELNKQLADGKITQEEYTRQVSGLNGQLAEQQIVAVDACNSFINLNAKMDDSQKKLENYQKQLQSGTDENGNKLTDEQISELNNQYTKELQNYEGYLKQKKELENKYGPMTEYTVSIALEKQGIDVDNINDELVKVKASMQDAFNSENFQDVNDYLKETYGVIAKINDSGDIEYSVTDTTSDAQKQTLEDIGALNDDGTVNIDLLYAGLTDEQKAEVDKLNSLQEKQNLINYYLSMNGVDTVQTAIDKLVTTLDNIYKLLAESPTFKANVESETKTALDGLLDKVRSWVGDHVANFISYVKERNAEERNNVNPETGMIGVNGTAHASGNWGLPSNEHNALVGELGPEMVVNPYTGRYYTVGDNGAEMVDLPKGSIIFNHKQTEDLLKNGYVTSRGKMLANGTAHAEGNAHVTFYPNKTVKSQWTGTGYSSWDDPTYDAAEALNDAADNLSDATDDFEEVFDWVEVRLEEIDETLSLLEAKLENAAYTSDKNSIIDQMIDINNSKLSNLEAGYQEYSDYAAKLLTEIPAKFQKAAQDGAIAIEKFVGEADEVTLEAIKNYREWAQKAADLKQKIEETNTEIRDLAIQRFDNAKESGDVRIAVEDSQTKKLQNAVDLDEAKGLVTSSAYYTAMMENSNKKIEYQTAALKAAQAAFDKAVKNGQIIRGSNEWYELVDELYQMEAVIDEATIELEEFQDAINDIYWDNFENLTDQFDYLQDQTQSLIDLMEKSSDLISTPKDKEYWGADDIEWTKEGIATLGLYAQKMQIAEADAKNYAEAIDQLTKDYKAGKYSQSEYQEKLDELTSKQYDAIDSYYEAKDAIVDLNKTRIDAIKNGVEKEIKAYEKLINKKKEELSAEKDLYDFQKSTMEQQKNIADIERKLAALSTDNSASAIAKKKQLEADLAQARVDLEESYYDRSIENQQNALDKELEDFQNEKNAEIEQWEQYLDNIEQVVADSLGIVQDNALGVYNTLNEKAQEYDLTLSDAVTSPWLKGTNLIGEYTTAFGDSASAIMDKLAEIDDAWQRIIDKQEKAGNTNVANINKENANYIAATKTSTPAKSTTPKKPTTQQKAAPSVGNTVTVKKSATHFSSKSGNAKMASFVPGGSYTVYQVSGDQILIGKNGSYTGWVAKKDLVGYYAKGTTSLKKSGFVNVDELGEELILGAQNGRITYLEKESGIIPADITSNLMAWGELNPQNMIEQNRPSIGISPDVHNTEINLSITYGDMVSIGEFHGDNLADLEKMVAKQFEKHTKDLNSALRRYTR